MARFLGLQSQPRLYLQNPKDGKWPGGAMVNNPPPEALLALHISTVLRHYCDTRGLVIQQAADAAGIPQKSMDRLINGRSWPNLVTIMRVEQGLGIQLWPGQQNTKHGTPLEHRPNCYLPQGGSWPDDPLVAKVPPEAEQARHVSTALRSALQARRLTSDEAASKATIPPLVVEGILNGNAWPDLAAIARLERELGVPLWPGLHNTKHGTPLEHRPNCYLPQGGSWPDDPLVDGAPPEAVLAHQLAKKFRGMYDGRYGNDASNAAGTLNISEATIESLLNGDSWPDLTTIARIERNHPIRMWVSQYEVGSDRDSD